MHLSTHLPSWHQLQIYGKESAAPQQPPAVASRERADKSAMLSVRMMEDTLEALAGYALDHGTTQRRIIAEALAKHGVRVSARDLEDRPQPRRRGGKGRA